MLDNSVLFWHSLTTPSAAPAALGDLMDGSVLQLPFPTCWKWLFLKEIAILRLKFLGTVFEEPLHGQERISAWQITQR